MAMSGERLKQMANVISTLQGYLTAIEKYPDDVLLDLNKQYSVFDILMEILNLFHVTRDELIEWLANYVKYALPIIELGVKGILLSNLKDTISCSVDPRIPNEARASGYTFGLNQIDATGMLRISPLIDENNQLYFGNNDAVSPYNFLRPKDFNTFLWYVVHRGKYPSPTYIKTGNVTSATIHPTYNDFFEKNFDGSIVSRNYSGKAESIFDITEVEYPQNRHNHGMALGTAYRQMKIVTQNTTSPLPVPLNGISVCSTVDYDTKVAYNMSLPNLELEKEVKNIRYNTLLPIGNTWNRTNYYVNRKTYFNFLDPTGKLDETNPRRYNQDIALCSFSYVDTLPEELRNKEFLFAPNAKINVRILPKPLVHIPHIGQMMALPKYILFNNHGEADKDGKFSVTPSVNGCMTNFNAALLGLGTDLSLSDIYKEMTDKNSNVDLSQIFDNLKDRVVWWYELDFPTKGSVIPKKSGFSLVLNYKGDYKITNVTTNVLNTGSTEIDWVSLPSLLENDDFKGDLLTLLTECYVNLTIYEFNYDYIMSMRLFDAKVVTTQLINQLLRFKIGVHFGIDENEIEGQERIYRIVEKLVNAEDYESSDCFYNFSNEEYEEMARKAEQKRANLIPFGDGCVSYEQSLTAIQDALNEFGNASEKQEVVDTFSRVINQVSAVIEQEGSDPDNEYSVSFNIITDFIKGLTMVIVNALLSPKIVLMILLNKQMCGQGAITNLKNISVDELIKQMNGLIIAIVKEIRDLILKELLKFVLRKVKDLMITIQEKLILEQIEVYRRLLKMMIQECLLGWRSSGGQVINTTLDNVGYADIDEPISQPTSDKC